MKIEQEFGNTIYNDGTIAMKVKYIFEDVVSMMLFFKDEVWDGREPHDGNSWEVDRSQLTITCTTFVQALDHYNTLIEEGEEEMKCKTCQEPYHDTCPMVKGCSCCENTKKLMEEEL